MVDREARDELAEFIEWWADGEIGALQFGASLDGICTRTQDETVRHVVDELALLNDDTEDYDDHTEDYLWEPDREGWDYLQRLLLLLRSDGEMVKAGGPKPSARQVVAAGTLALAATVSAASGFCWAAVLGSAACCAVVMLILSRSEHSPLADAAGTTDAGLLYPFSSAAEMLALHRTVPSFRKRRFDPPHGHEAQLQYDLDWVPGHQGLTLVDIFAFAVILITGLCWAPLLLLMMAFSDHNPAPCRIVVPET